jgi:putative glycosyltransferase (TIGR04372 family)
MQIHDAYRRVRGYLSWFMSWARFASFIAIVFLFRIMKRFGWRFGLYPEQFGHQVNDVEHWLRPLSAAERRKFIVIHKLTIPNKYLYKKHREIVRFIEVSRWTIQFLKGIHRLGKIKFKTPLFHGAMREKVYADEAVWSLFSPIVQFNSEEQRSGQKILSELGLIAGQYACLHARDSVYSRGFYPQMLAADGKTISEAKEMVDKSEGDLFTVYRNAEFRNYAQSLETLAKYGLKGVRMGAKVERAYNDIYNLVDYAGSHRSRFGSTADFADVYIMAHCRLYVGTPTGVTGMAMSFNRPMVFHNVFPWPWGHFPGTGHSLYMPKPWKRRDGSLWTFGEMIDFSKRIHWHAMLKDAFFQEFDIQPIDNPPDLVGHAVDELCLKLVGKWINREEDERRHRKLEDLFQQLALGDRTSARMPNRFVQVYESLIR